MHSRRCTTTIPLRAAEQRSGNWRGRRGLSESSRGYREGEFRSRPAWRAAQCRPNDRRTGGRLLLVTFLGGARKVTCRRATPGELEAPCLPRVKYPIPTLTLPLKGREFIVIMAFLLLGSYHVAYAQEKYPTKIIRILTAAPGDGNALGGLKVVTENAWFAARPSGTEDIYKIYAESFHGHAHLRQVQMEAQKIVTDALSA